MLVVPLSNNVRTVARRVKGVAMVSPEWGLLDTLASPGRQPDAALEALAALKEVAA